MPTPVEIAVDTYIRAVSERDATKRAALLDSCFADDARFIPRGNVLVGRTAIAAMITRFLDDPQSGTIRVKAIDARGKTFRFAVVNDRADGTSLEVFDAGEIDDDGRIKLILTFNGPLSAD
jgi:uncharacterized protein (TIGR02246 family)